MDVYRPSSDGRPGGSTGGGNNSGTQTAGVPANIAATPITGGLTGAYGVLLLPLFDMNAGTQVFESLNLVDFNTEQSSTYQFKVEDFVDGATTTISRLRIKYRNIGKCKFTILLQGMYTYASKTITIGPGTKNGQTRAVPNQADYRLYNAYCDMVFTDESPQLIIQRAANAGPLDIVSITLMGGEHKPQKGA